jgi:hypothetical protein
VTPDALAAGLRWFFWGLVYLATLLAAVFAFGPAGQLKWVAFAAIVYVIADDVRRKRGSVKA